MRSCFWLSLLVLAGCAADTTEDADATEDELRLGAVTHDTPQIGELKRWQTGSVGVCTGTLVGPRTVLAAAHCFGYGTAAVGSGRFGDFNITALDGKTTTNRVIDGYVSYGKEPGSSDVALYHLVAPVTDFAPIPLRKDRPWLGETVKIYGYGIYDCTRTGTEGRLDGNKRSYSFTWGFESHATCGGDSGGPTMYAGGVFQVTSSKTSYYLFETTNAGQVGPLYDTLQKQIRAWP